MEVDEIQLKRMVKRYNRVLIVKAVRYCCIISILGMSSAVLLEYFFYPQFSYDFFVIRLISNIFTGIILLLTYSKLKNKNPSLLYILDMAIPCLAMNIMIYISEGSTSPYYVGLILIILIAVTLIPGYIRDILIIIIIVITCYIFTCLLHTKTPLNIKIFLGNLYFLLFVSGLSFTVNYINSRIRFDEFKSRYNNVKLQRALDKIQTLLKEREQAQNLNLSAVKGLMW